MTMRCRILSRIRLLHVVLGLQACYGFQPASVNFGISSSPVYRGYYVSASAISSFSDFGDSSRSTNTTTAASGAKPWTELLFNDEADVDQDAIDLLMRQRRLQQGSRGWSRNSTYRVSLPLVSAESVTTDQEVAVGLKICEVQAGRSVGDSQLDLDSLEVSSLPRATSSSSAPDGSASQTSMSRDEIAATLHDSKFRGLIVSSVDPRGVAWQQGVRPGDILFAVSATLGEALWLKSTLEGVRSAILSRRMTSTTLDLELQRCDADSTNQYELTLTRPIGLVLKEPSNGFGVEVTGLSSIAPTLVKYAVKVGDRVVAVDSALGDRMWPVSTVEGVISACTARLPGQSITLRFERPAGLDVSSSGRIAGATTSISSSSTASLDAPSTEAQSIGTTNKELLSRCRDVLRRYKKDNDTPHVQSKFSGKFALPAIVADKVVDALASSGASVDSVTLSMIMDAYLSCGQPDRALRIFEAATGFYADGSVSEPSTPLLERGGKSIVPNEAAINLHSGTTLLKAHSMKGDLPSVRRVLTALEGRSGVAFVGLESAPWPWTGEYGSIQLDTMCYNVAMAAAEKAGGAEALQFALEVFDKLGKDSNIAAPDSALGRVRTPCRDVVSYNTLISMLGNEGRLEDAFRLLDEMKRSGIRPDKYTYTSLIKACHNYDDIQELLYDMQELGVAPDCVTYNTMIKSLGEGRRWTLATRLITEMESRGVAPDSMTYGYLMNAMLKTGKPSACLTLFESACSSPKTKALTENVYLYTTAITAAAKLGDHERALELVSRMNALGIRPNLITLTAVMGACLSSGRADLASQLFQRVDQPDGCALALGIQALCADCQVHEALKLLTQHQRGRRAVMNGKDVMRSYNSLVKASLDQDDFAVARAGLADLFRKGYIPSKSIVATISETMTALSDNLDVEEVKTSVARHRFSLALYVIDMFVQRKVPVDGRFYTSTISNASRMGGPYRKVGALMVQAKMSVQSTKVQQILTPLTTSGSSSGDAEIDGAMSDDSFADVPAVGKSWEDLFLNFDSYKDLLLTATTNAPPRLSRIPVRVASRDVPRVLRAEQALTIGKASVGKASRPMPKRAKVL